MQYPTRESDVVFAKALIAMAKGKSISMNMTKLQKLLYIAYGVMLASGQGRLLKGRAHAWPYGPVFPRIREELLGVNFDRVGENREDSELPSEVRSLFEAVLDKFGGFSASSLSNWSHKEESPWWRVISLEQCAWNTVIPDEYIEMYFKENILKSV